MQQTSLENKTPPARNETQAYRSSIPALQGCEVFRRFTLAARVHMSTSAPP